MAASFGGGIVKKVLFFSILGVLLGALCISPYFGNINVTRFLLVAWSFWLIVGGWFAVGEFGECDRIFRQMHKADKGDCFRKKIDQLEMLYYAVISREDYYSTLQNSYVELYCSVKNKMEANLRVVYNYLRAYDYVTRPKKSSLVKQLVDENKMLVEKLNTLTECLVRVDASSEDFSTKEIDDTVAALLSIITKG